MNIVIYEDKKSLRDSLTLLIDSTDGFSVLGGFPNCANVVQEVTKLAPDIVLMDIDMPEVDGIEGVELIKEKLPLTKVLMYTVYDDNDKLFACLKAGANGYLLKKTTKPVELIGALKDAYSGGAPMSPKIASRVLDTFSEIKPQSDEYNLSSREVDVLKLLAQGHSYKTIATELFIGITTVTTHLQNIYKKLHVNCATQALIKAIKEKLIDLDDI